MRLGVFVISGFALLFSPTCAAEKGVPTELLSIQGVNIPKDWFVSGFRVKMWGVWPMAACRIPDQWHVTAGKNSDPEGVLSGKGDVFGSYLGAQSLAKIQFLVKVVDYRPRASARQPASFTGTITIQTFGDAEHGDPKPRLLRLRPENFVRVNADRCPD